MTATVNNLHTRSHGYIALMLLLAMGTATYGIFNLRSIVAAGYPPSVEPADRLVIGFFNVATSLTAISAISFIAI
jgi:hypothetical protein